MFPKPYKTTHPLGNPQGPPLSSLASSPSGGLSTVVCGLSGSLLAAAEDDGLLLGESVWDSGVGVASQFQWVFMYSAKSLP